MSLVEGFGGFRVVDGVPHFTTTLPSAWTSFSFKVRVRDRLLRINVVGESEASVVLESGESIKIVLNGADLNLPES